MQHIFFSKYHIFTILQKNYYYTIIYELLDGLRTYQINNKINQPKINAFHLNDFRINVHPYYQ